MTLKSCLLIIYFLFTNSVFEARSIESKKFIKTEDYLIVQIEDRKIYIHPEIKNSAIKKDLMDLLKVKLFDVKRVLPEFSYEKIKDVSIWVDNGDFGCPGACYHPSKIWLAENGLNPDKEKSIQIGSPELFLEWTKQQPFMILHELAHAYHHQFLGYWNEDVNKAYERALDSGSYEEVLHWNGDTVRHYGLNNSQEYFAESTEAYFGVNDFYPFVRGELKVHDYEMYILINDLWNPIDDEAE
tara:strand:+ start:629 stop:1354 length:726 start_codon:yes stop_codon:yes gene_type:complete